MKNVEELKNLEEETEQIIGGAGQPCQEPPKPIIPQKCPLKPCIYKSRSKCPYYSNEIEDCNK